MSGAVVDGAAICPACGRPVGTRITHVDGEPALRLWEHYDDALPCRYGGTILGQHP